MILLKLYFKIQNFYLYIMKFTFNLFFVYVNTRKLVGVTDSVM